MKMPERSERLVQCMRTLSAIILCLFLAACGFTAPRYSDGYAELESLGMADVDQTLSLSIGPTLLRFVASHLDDDPEVSRMLRGLDGVRIRIYEINGDPGRVAARMQLMGEHLQQDGWESVALIREQKEETRMLIRIKEDQIRGMTFLTSDGKSEAVVVNLMGEIQPQQFSQVMLALDVGTPGVENVRVVENSN